MKDELHISPLVIEILLHYHWSAVDVELLDSSPATVDVCNKLAKLGILKENTEGSPVKYIPNRSAIQVYVEALLAVPLPILKWVI